MANPSCIWFDEKTCYLNKLPKAEEFAQCIACMTAVHTGDKVAAVSLRSDRGPQ